MSEVFGIVKPYLEIQTSFKSRKHLIQNKIESETLQREFFDEVDECFIKIDSVFKESKYK